MWIIVDGKLTSAYFEDAPSSPMKKPYPDALWRIDPTVNGGMPYNKLLPEPENLGAFAHAKNLRRASIPESVKYIGEYAFRGTALTSVTIASDCEYYRTSFPDGCVIKFYNYDVNFETSDGEEFITSDDRIFEVQEE